jgi:hypothetical protein
MDGQTKWTHLRPGEIKSKLANKGVIVSEKTVVRLLRLRGFRKRGFYKNLIKENVEGRNEQFEKIARLRKHYLSRGYIVLSIDCKKKEPLGDFFRAGGVYCTVRVQVPDHDFIGTGNSKMAPYGIFDEGRKESFMLLSESADTAEFSVSCLGLWWKDYGSKHYPEGTPILILCDGGGSNGSKNNLFKHGLDQMAKRYGMSIRVAHYPPYCSKYNRIEHRVFPVVTAAWKGVILNSLKQAKEYLVERTRKLKSGLKMVVRLCRKQFEKGIKIPADVVDKFGIVYDEINPKWNYRFSTK